MINVHEEISAYDYALPKAHVAHQPAARRDAARLMLLPRHEGEVRHYQVRDLPELLAPGDLLVLNDSRVVKARLVGRRAATGGRWEGLFLEALEDGTWRILSQTRGKPRPGERVIIGKEQPGLDPFILELLGRDAKGTWRARPNLQSDAFAALAQFGEVPLPPYITRDAEWPGDAERYQTVYARSPGSVAAPTAGLHFTPELLLQCARRGIEHVFVTLHVGMGTFRPVTARRLDQHVMHAERYEITWETSHRIARARRAGGRVIAVGTTTVRALESAAAGDEIQPGRGETQLFIRPPHTFRAIDGLLTNFHLPRSTLLVLVCTLAGQGRVFNAYAQAVAAGYRFYSYGDCMLIL